MSELRHWLDKDRQNLLKLKDITPPNWSHDSYQNFIDRSELWYNSTLLVAALGPSSGFLMWAGDGGIELVKTGKAQNPKSKISKDKVTVLSSTEDVSIDTFVSLSVSIKDFSLARISYDESLSKVDIYLSSDGVDRTLQKNAEFLNYESLELKDYKSARHQLESLSKLPNRDNDNFSVAQVSRILDAEATAETLSFSKRCHSDKPSELKDSAKATEESLPKDSPEDVITSGIIKNPEVKGSDRQFESEKVSTYKGFLKDRFVAGLVAGLLVGLAIGLAAMRIYDSQSMPSNNPDNTTSPDDETDLRGSEQPKPILINSSTNPWLNGGKLSRELSIALDEWLST